MAGEQNNFDPSYFEHIRRVEGTYFWYSVRRSWIHDMIKKHVSPPAKVLDAGCGTGNVGSFLSGKGFDVTGCDYYAEALNLSWPGFNKVQGNVCDLPFKDHSFDVVGLFDVIEHLDNDLQPIKEAKRVLNKNGLIAITVPAKEELWSSIDESSFHKRRYSKEHVRFLLDESGFEPLLIEYMFMSLYLPMKYLRAQKIDRLDQFKLNPPTNLLLKAIFHIERILSRWFSLPTGTSLIAIARKIEQ